MEIPERKALWEMPRLLELAWFVTTDLSNESGEVQTAFDTSKEDAAFLGLRFLLCFKLVRLIGTVLFIRPFLTQGIRYCKQSHDDYRQRENQGLDMRSVRLIRSHDGPL